jgi:uncharacterized membrane protein (DUF4010 family)
MLMRNPFRFWSVVAMALSMGAVLLFARIVAVKFGSAGATVSAAITGIFDVDATAISMTRLFPVQLDARQAALAIVVGTASATLGKVPIGMVLGGRRFALGIAAMSVFCCAAGAATFLLVATPG